MTERLPPAPDPDQLPEPRNAEIMTLSAGRVWARVYFSAGRHPTRWDQFRTVALPAPSRFDAFGAPAVDGIAYAAVPHGGPPPGTPVAPLAPGDASGLATCLAEAAQDGGVLDRLDQRTFAVAELTAPVRLLDLASDWATRAGAGTHLSTAPRRETSTWACAVATRWPDLDGLAYIASTRPAGRAVALWSPRCAEAVATSRLLLLRRLDDPVMYGAVAWAAHATGTTVLRHPAPQSGQLPGSRGGQRPQVGGRPSSG